MIIVTQSMITIAVDKAKSRTTLLSNQMVLEEVLGNFSLAEKLEAKIATINALILALTDTNIFPTMTDAEKANAYQKLLVVADVASISSEFDYSCTPDYSLCGNDIALVGGIKIDGTLPLDHLNSNHIINTGVYTHIQIDSHINSTSNPHDTSLSNLIDTVLTSPVLGEVLTYDGNDWVNGPGGTSGIKLNSVAQPVRSYLDFTGAYWTMTDDVNDNNVSLNFSDDGTLSDATSSLITSTRAIKEYIDGLGLGLNAENGLSLVNSNTVKLGGVLNTDTIIQQGPNTIDFIADNNGTYNSLLTISEEANQFIQRRASTTAEAGLFVGSNMAHNAAGIGILDRPNFIIHTSVIEDVEGSAIAGVNKAIKFYDNRSTATGFEYDQDYSSTFVGNSMITKTYADYHIGGRDVSSEVRLPQLAQDGMAIVWDNTANQYILSTVSGGGGGGDYTFTNGLNEGSNIAKLGGTLTENTSIDANSHTLTLNNLGGFYATHDGYTTNGSSFSVSNDIILVKHKLGEPLAKLVLTSLSDSGTIVPVAALQSEDVEVRAYNNKLTVYDNRTTKNGIEYEDNYHADYTLRSLVDKEYVDNNAGSSYTASNGVTLTGSNFTLGGTLSASTVLTDSRGTKLGLQYAADYSGDFNNRSLVDKEYVDTLLTFGDLTTRVGNTVSLGGTWSQAGVLSMNMNSKGVEWLNVNDFRVDSGSVIRLNGSTVVNTLINPPAGIEMYLDGDFYATGNVTFGSDIRLKKDLEELPYGLETILDINTYKYKLRADDSEQIGLIADELENIIPEVTFVPEEEEAYKGIDYAKIVTVLIKAVQELKQQLDAVTERG